jgi:DNA invertase Pin-like site-specific DNA recombinase
MRAGAYVRVSTEEQVQGGHSLDAQRRQLRAACEGRGWELVEVFIDAGASGASMRRRPGLAALLAAVQAHHIDVAVVTDLDRLSRSPRDLYTMLDTCFAQNGAAFYAVGQGIDSTTPMGAAMIGIASVFAKLERDLLSERTKRGMAEGKRQGHIAGMAPYGWRRQGGFLVEVPEDQAALAQARNLRRSGKTLRAVAEVMGWTLKATWGRLGRGQRRAAR